MSEKVERTTNRTSLNKLPGATLNAICPYFTMFPLEFPLGILSEYASQEDEVIDPFCGRGTTNCASRLSGLKSYGIDSSPVAVAISEAKLANATSDEVLEAYDDVMREVPVPKEVPESEFWQWAFHPEVLQTICRLREGLLKNNNGGARKALRAIIMGAIHGPKNPITPSYFSNQSPRTYSPKPRYALKFWKERGLKPQKVDIRNIIRARAERYYTTEQRIAEGKIVLGDSRCSSTYQQLGSVRAKWVITSPPYYGMRTYIPDQWIRNWFVGGSSDVDYSSEGQVSHLSPDQFAADLRTVWRNLASVCTDDAQMIIRFGAINNRKADHIKIIQSSICDSGWKILDIKPAGSAKKGNRQADSFLTRKSNAIEEVDVWASRQ